MKRKNFLKTAGFGLLGLNISKNIQAAKSKPNVIFIFTDDQRPDAIGFSGNKILKTPNIDKIAKKGVIFKNVYCQGSTKGAVCLPARTQTLSGNSMFKARDTVSGSESKRYSFPKFMKDAGYITMRSGKAGNHPVKICKEFDKYLEIKRNNTCTEEHTNNGIAFIKENAGKKPFFLYLAYGTPHDPQPAPQKYYDMYNPNEMPLSKTFKPFHPFNNGDLFVRDEQTVEWPRTKKNLGEKMAKYYASITYTDDQIGRLLDTLEKTGQKDNTIVIFASDNGLSMGDHGLLGKQNLYEYGGMHVPLIFSGPGISHGYSDALTYLHDIYTTVCELIGLTPPKEVDGKSLKSVINKTQKKVRDYIYCGYKYIQRSVRDTKWKLHYYPAINRTLLFDLENDPYEQKDLAENSKYKGKFDEMMNILIAQKQSYEDKKIKFDFKKPKAEDLDLNYYLANKGKSKKKKKKKK